MGGKFLGIRAVALGTVHWSGEFLVVELRRVGLHESFEFGLSLQFEAVVLLGSGVEGLLLALFLLRLEGFRWGVGVDLGEGGGLISHALVL